MGLARRALLSVPLLLVGPAANLWGSGSWVLSLQPRLARSSRLDTFYPVADRPGYPYRCRRRPPTRLPSPSLHPPRSSSSLSPRVASYRLSSALPSPAPPQSSASLSHHLASPHLASSPLPLAPVTLPRLISAKPLRSQPLALICADQPCLRSTTTAVTSGTTTNAADTSSDTPQGTHRRLSSSQRVCIDRA